VLNFPNGFAGTTSQFRFNGSSAKIVGSSLQLTSAANQAASIFARTSVNVARFSTSFNIQLLKGTNPIADGMTFTIQNAGLTAVGSAGGGLGYASLRKSVAVKFDLYNNTGEGVNSTGLYTNGASPTGTNSINLTGTGIDLHSGHVFSVAMTYDGTKLQVTITDTVTHATATQSYTVNIPTIVGSSTAFVGFTGGTGSLTAVQNILNWTYTVIPAGSAPAASPASVTTTTSPLAAALRAVVASPARQSPNSGKISALMYVAHSGKKRVRLIKPAQSPAHDAVIAGTDFWGLLDSL
jgi:hypothetical protein